MFGNGFDRRAIVNAHALRALLDSDEIKLSKEASKLRDVPTSTYSDTKYQTLREELDCLELEDVVCFFCLCLKRDGYADHYVHGGVLLKRGDKPYGGAVGLADAYARIHDPAGVEIKLSNSDNDPTQIAADIHDPIAEAWADVHGSQQGSTWEGSGDAGFLYDYWIWHPKLIEELTAQGLNLDLSEYSDCDEQEIAIATHANDCPSCSGSYSKAEPFFESPLTLMAHERRVANGEEE